MIAEISANHGGDIERAKKTMLAAKGAGADAVKMQTYTPDTMTLNCDKEDFLITEGLWSGYNLFNLYQEAYTPYEWHNELFSFARENSILLFSTPFDESAVDLLESLDTPAYKIASFEVTDIPLIEYVSSKRKPLFISTGMASLEEIADAVECCYSNANRDLLLFHCISEYPADLKTAHLGDINYLAKYFGVEVGLSDHTLDITAATLAVARGASAIEKHFKLDETECGPDSSFSITPDGLRSLVSMCSDAHQGLKSNELKRTKNEMMNKRFRRSIYFVHALRKGDQIKRDDIRRVRPGYGMEPKFFDALVGRRVSTDVEFGDAVTPDRIENSGDLLGV